MQKGHLIGALIAVVIVAVGLFVLLRGEGGSIPLTQGEFLVSLIKTDVFIKDAAETDFNMIEEEAVALGGSVVKTSPSGRSIIEGPNQSITVVDRNSEITLVTVSEKGSTIILEAGNVWSRVEKTLEQGEFYEMKTEHAVATVRGTSFGTFLLKDSSEFIVHEGTVTFFLIDSETGERIPSSETRVTGPKKVIVDSAQGVIVLEISEKDKASEWYKFNVSMDEAPGETNVKEKSTIIIDDFDVIREIPPPSSVEKETVEEEAEVITPDPKEAPQSLQSVNPSEVVLSENEGFIVLRGEGLLSVMKLFMGESDTTFSAIDDTELHIFISDIQDTGLLDIAAIFEDGRTAELSQALSVEEFPLEFIKLSGLVPNEVEIGVEAELVTISLEGEHLDLVEQVEVDGQLIEEFQIISDKIIIFSSSEIMQIGTLTVTVRGGPWVASLPLSLSVVGFSQEPQ